MVELRREHVFVRKLTLPMTNEELTAQAADLAEGILDEISRASQDWALIADLARQLAELVAGGPDD